MLRTFLRRLFKGIPRMLTVGSPAPSFRLSDHTGAVVDSNELAGSRYILWFYPKADTPG
ncbi:MAG: redoxin domain-containing protein [Planctomycetota bacterium]|jgi:peroxiredoxin Q/BCP